ncbi:YbaB/EbfC family nucleoid-associated protein [Actinophytocola sediminis]
MERSTTELTGRFAEYARLAEQVKAMRDQVDEIRGTGYSDDGLVTVVVGGRGEVRELELDPRIYRDQNSAELATKILAAISAAAEDADREATKFAEGLLAPRRPGDQEIDPMFDPVLHLLDETTSAMEDRR